MGSSGEIEYVRRHTEIKMRDTGLTSNVSLVKMESHDTGSTSCQGEWCPIYHHNTSEPFQDPGEQARGHAYKGEKCCGTHTVGCTSANCQQGQQLGQDMISFASCKASCDNHNANLANGSGNRCQGIEFGRRIADGEGVDYACYGQLCECFLILGNHPCQTLQNSPGYNVYLRAEAGQPPSCETR